MALAEQSAQKTAKTNGTAKKVRSKPAANVRMPIVADLSNLRILKDRFVLDVHSGTFHRVSETAAFILCELKHRTPIAELVIHYANRYEISRAIAERDVELFLNDPSVSGLPDVRRCAS